MLRPAGPAGCRSAYPRGHGHRDEPARRSAAARRACPEPARPRRPAVGDPPVLRHPRDDGRRHQPRRRRARLRHAAARSSRPASPACARSDPLHQQLRHDRAAPGAVGPPRAAATASATTRRREILITVGASEAVDLALRATCDPGDEVILHEPSYVAYVPAIMFAGGVAGPRRDPARGRLRARSRRRRGGDHAAHQGAVPRLPVQPDRRRAAATTSRTSSPRIAERHDLLVFSDEIYDRLVYGGYRHRAIRVAAGHARADDPDGRLLQGLRDDRLAGRLRCARRGDPRGHRQGPPVRDHVGADDRPGRGARGAPERRAGRPADGRRVRPPPPDVRRRAQRDRACRPSSRTGAFYAFPADHAAPA